MKKRTPDSQFPALKCEEAWLRRVLATRAQYLVKKWKGYSMELWKDLFEIVYNLHTLPYTGPPLFFL